MKLLIAIPALNEEEAIESIIERSLAAREYITRNSPVNEVEITVVSDGSTDETVGRASRYKDRIRLIVFPKNRGYGAAIKEAWKQSDADLLGFLDADGTCDPLFFADLCRDLESKKADVALGCRLNANSEMPPIRRLGNRIFATLLSVFSSSPVRDTASGMRVVRKSCLRHIFPLPDGLHFTPAMSARSMLSDAVKIVEIDMRYCERTGESKLRVGKDGLRFLRVIVEAALLYRPSRPFDLVALSLFVGAALLMLQPLLYYFTTRTVAEWMIYRFLVSSLAATTACLCFCASFLSGRITQIALRDEVSDRNGTWVSKFFQSRWFWLLPSGLALFGGALVLASFVQLVTTGATYEHWSRYVVMTYCFTTAIILGVTRTIDVVLGLVADRVVYLAEISAAAEKHESHIPLTPRVTPKGHR